MKAPGCEAEKCSSFRCARPSFVSVSASSHECRTIFHPSLQGFSWADFEDVADDFDMRELGPFSILPFIHGSNLGTQNGFTTREYLLEQYTFCCAQSRQSNATVHQF